MLLTVLRLKKSNKIVKERSIILENATKRYEAKKNQMKRHQKELVSIINDQKHKL
jgi:hypothetical protein